MMNIGVGIEMQTYREGYRVEKYRGRYRKGCRNRLWIQKVIAEDIGVGMG